MEGERDRERKKNQILKEKQPRKAEKAQQKKWTYSNQRLLVCFICFSISLCGADNIGESVTVELATKPILFAHDVDLVCTIRTADTLAHMAWTKIPYGETIAVNNETTNNLKYHIDVKYESSAMKYKLTIRKFAQSDVNVLYRCDSGFLSQYENLQLNAEDYIAMPEKNEIVPKISFGDGYLRGTIQVNSVYPELYNCAAIFEGEDITHHLKTANSSTTRGSIFYNMVIEMSHQTAKCKGTLNVTCFVGIKRLQLMTQDINECSNQMPDKGIPGEIFAIVLPIVSVVMLVLVCSVCSVCYLRKRKAKRDTNQEDNTNVPLTQPKPVSDKHIGVSDEVRLTF